MEKATEMGSILRYFFCRRESTSWIFLVPKRRHILDLSCAQEEAHLGTWKAPKRKPGIGTSEAPKRKRRSEGLKQETPTYKVTKRSLARKLTISGVGTRKS